MERILASLMVTLLISPSSYASEGWNQSVNGQQQQVAEQAVYRVADAEEFLDAIGSNRRIILAPGDYDLTAAAEERGVRLFEAVAIGPKHDGYEVIIHDVSNLTIEGTEEAGRRTRLLGSARFGNVLSFERVTNVVVSNLVAEHSTVKGTYGWGDLLSFVDSSGVTLDHLDLTKSAGHGLSLDHVVDLTISNSNIRECEGGIQWIKHSSNIMISDGSLINNSGSDMIEISVSNGVTFRNMTITGNKKGRYHSCDVDSPSFLFAVETSRNVKVEYSIIRDNDACNCVPFRDSVTFTRIEGLRNGGFGGRFECPPLWDVDQMDWPSQR